jgi:malyl-CoA/(S)-citramalyl-CoA lyase
MTSTVSHPRRSILSVPGHVAKMHAKAQASSADVVMFDLEDSVPLSEKASARRQVAASLRELDWSRHLVALRINPVETAQAYRDLVDVMRESGKHLHSIVLPKVEHVGDVHFADRLLTGLELEGHGREDGERIALEPSIESALGLERASDIASASERNISLVFGIADYTASVGAKLVSISGHGENDEAAYGGHRWHYVLSRIVMCAKARGLRAIDAPWGHFKDQEGLVRAAAQAAALGCCGKWAIHPCQIDTINSTFAPDADEMVRVLAIVEAARSAEANQSRGAIAVEGRMVDQATVRLARRRYEEVLRLKELGKL